METLSENRRPQWASWGHNDHKVNVQIRNRRGINQAKLTRLAQVILLEWSPIYTLISNKQKQTKLKPKAIYSLARIKPPLTIMLSFDPLTGSNTKPIEGAVSLLMIGIRTLSSYKDPLNR